ncbi:DUF1343 domain-containing protein [Reichenbachiella agarivorans]|uniref:DUF1343 domain-containing protein n=1 Tax=Reichenbachiella agarivorans TaxID=2979464 RepID=A0ABY6CSH2_9BACT|nr:DUF1343 domain-containing protein [Reichenbachiella agarivorans]UXP33474.1 DUF1343 domain-containing protein [Reichenbachiella agarivorans]
MKTQTGLSQLKDHVSSIKGNVAYLCHAASVDEHYQHGILTVKNLFGDRLKKLFSPQHGIFADVQDNMVETDHFFHEHFQLPVYSLYSETRKPTPEMLEGIDHVIVDLQDVGTRVYTYIYTLTYMMEACAELGIEVIVLDRPNPIGGVAVEGNVLDMDFRSFVGRYPIPMRHGMTMGEVAMMGKKYWGLDCALRVITMTGWTRDMFFWETQLPWVLPSPNLAAIETAFTFTATVIFEGTNISEGRGTTKSLETVGHPSIKNYELLDRLNREFQKAGLTGFVLRPVSFVPTFQKHTGKVCHGYQIHVTDYVQFKPWRVGQMLNREFYHHLGENFAWKQPPYEYEAKLLPIDILNGTDLVRKWIERNGSYQELEDLEKHDLYRFKDLRKDILLY